MPVSNLTALCFAMGQQGGTVHQVASDLGVDVADIINADDARMDDLLRMAQAHGRKVPADRAAALDDIAIVSRMISTDRHSAADYEAAWKALDRIQAALMQGGVAVPELPAGWEVYCIGRDYINGYRLEARHIESGKLMRDLGMRLVFGRTIPEVFKKASDRIAAAPQPPIEGE